MDLLNVIDRISKIGKPPEELSRQITSIEAGYLWQTIFTKYNVIRLSQKYYELAEDADLKLVIKQGLDFLQDEARIIERECKKYGVPVPDMPPEFIEINTRIDAVNDKFIFEQIYEGIRGMLPLRIHAYIASRSIGLRHEFRVHLDKELKIYSGFTEYGLLKGFVELPPTYRP